MLGNNGIKPQVVLSLLQSVGNVYSLLLKSLKCLYSFDSDVCGFSVTVHYGAELATPIHIDTSTRSRIDISDQLWGFVSSQW